MRTKTIFVCQYCGKEFDDQLDCLHHELEELGISFDILMEWRILKRKIKNAKDDIAASNRKNSPELKTEYNKALGALSSFAAKYGLKGKETLKY